MKDVDRGILAVALGWAIAQGAQAELSMNVGVTSNSVWRGVTQTSDGPAIQGGIDYRHESGLYVGTWASNVEYYDEKGAELDLYAGFAGAVADLSWKAGVTAYTYPDSDRPDHVTANNFTELGVSATYGWVTLGAALTLGGEGPSEATFEAGDDYLYASVAVPRPENFTLGVTGGYYRFDNRAAYDDAGARLYGSRVAYHHALVSLGKELGDWGSVSLNVSKAWTSRADELALGTEENMEDVRVFVSWVKVF